MKRHPFDPVSFLFGAAFLTFAAVVVSTDPLDLFEATWIWPAVLIVLGAGLLLAPLAQRSRVDRNAPTADPAWPTDDHAPVGGDPQVPAARADDQTEA